MIRAEGEGHYDRQLRHKHLEAAEPDAVVAVLRLAAGQWSETDFADWLTANSE